MSSTPLAYIYVRWSKAEQSDGDSERRQLADISAWCRLRGYVTDPSRIYIDRGTSGFAGAHLARGQLGKLIREVIDGKVPAGSVLVVEAYDRISRLPSREARRVIDTLIDRDIKIGVVNSDQVLDAESSNDLVNEVGMVLRVNLAHEESRLKRMRSKANWDRKRADALSAGTVATRGGPRWLDWIDGKWITNSHAETVREAFRLCLEDFGATTIASRFNREGRPLLAREGMKVGAGGVGSKWTSSAVLNILRSPASFGAWQPRHADRSLSRETDDAGGTVYRTRTKKVDAGDLVRNYYVPVISEEDWHQAQRQIDVRRNSGGNKGRITNVLAGVIYCAACGGRLQLAGQRAHKHDALYCRDAQLGKCMARGTLRLDAIDGPILKRAAEAFEILRAKRDPEQSAAVSEIRRLETQRATLQSNLDLLLAEPAGDKENFLALFRRIAGTIADLDSQIAGHRARVAELEAQKPDDPGMEHLLRDYHGPRGETRDLALRRLNGALRRVVERIDLHIASSPYRERGDWEMRTLGGWANVRNDWSEWHSWGEFLDAIQNSDEDVKDDLSHLTDMAAAAPDQIAIARRLEGRGVARDASRHREPSRSAGRQKSPGPKPRA